MMLLEPLNALSAWLKLPVILHCTAMSSEAAAQDWSLTLAMA